MSVEGGTKTNDEDCIVVARDHIRQGGVKLGWIILSSLSYRVRGRGKGILQLGDTTSGHRQCGGRWVSLRSDVGGSHGRNIMPVSILQGALN